MIKHWNITLPRLSLRGACNKAISYFCMKSFCRYVIGHTKLFLSLLFCILTINTQSLNAQPKLPPHTPVPGGIAVIPIPIDLASDNGSTKAWFQNNRVMLLQTPNSESQWTAIVGIPLGAKAGKHHLLIENGSPQKSRIPFQVEPKSYKEQHLTIKNKRQVNPYQKDLERIAREKQEITAAFKSWQEIPFPVTELTLPVDGEISSPFGLKRFFNGEPRKPHSGLDIAALEGTPIYAPAAGRVLTTGNYFFNGNTVMVDHGNGLVTMYCHMSQIDVEAGSKVAKGDAIGLVGKTGRVTGPHLHWSVSLNNARIAPSLLISEAP